MTHAYFSARKYSKELARFEGAFRSVFLSSWRDHLRSAQFSPEWIKTKLDKEADHGSFTRFMLAIIVLVISLYRTQIKNCDVYVIHDLRLLYLAKLRINALVIIVSSESRFPRILSKGVVLIPSYCFSVPIVRAILIRRPFGLFFTIFITLRFLKGSRLLFITYSDQVRVAEFFQVLNKLLPNSSALVVVQHGYFVNHYHPAYRLDGAKCDNHILQHASQRFLFSKKKCIEGGMPYDIDSAKGCSNLVVFVGVGRSGKLPDGSDNLIKALSFYAAVVTTLTARGNIAMTYRPHPSETGALEARSYLPSLRLSTESKVELLGMKKSVFVGFESTLLFEAGLVGHSIVVISRKNATFSVVCNAHARFCESQIDQACEGIVTLAGSETHALYPRPAPLTERLRAQQNFLLEILLQLEPANGKIKS
jgi:hypothetical protein